MRAITFNQAARRIFTVPNPQTSIHAPILRWKKATIATALTVLLASLCASGAKAQSTAQLLTQPSGWSFSVAPYLWLPDIHANLDYNVADGRGSRLPTDIAIGPGKYISGLHFAFQGAAEARYGRFSILTDLVYLDTGGGRSRFRELDTPGQPPNLSVGLQASTSIMVQSAVWTETGGYTVLWGDWGNLDVLAGFRLLNASARTDYSVNAGVTGPLGGDAALGRTGSLSRGGAVWNGIAGFRGNVRLGESPFFVPYYFDIGGGGSHPTWQIASGLGYQARWGAISVTYRYLSFQQSNKFVAAHLQMYGPMLMGTFRF
ncbi:MAG TPA: hypothetical protein VL356_02920 [Acidocella sp.]|jgi:hypothetical protein|nr:hypothetical protein [Acidocella sp.]